MKQLSILFLFFGVKGFAQDAINLKDLVGDKKVVYFGEVHSDTSSKNFLAAKLPELKKLGFTHVVLEMFNKDSQDLLDRYAAGKAGDKEVIAYLIKNWAWAPYSYLPLLKAARELKLKMIALDKRSPGIVEEPRDDAYMAQMITQVVRTQTHRAVVLIGVSHIDSNDEARALVQYQPGILLESHKIESFTYAILPLHKTDWDFRTVDKRFSPGTCTMVPGCMRIRVYFPYNEPVHETLRSLGKSTDEIFVHSSRGESGFDGLLVLDAYNTDAPMFKDE